MTDTTSANPLQLGQTLYALDDLTIVAAAVSGASDLLPPTCTRFTLVDGVASAAPDPVALSAASMNKVRDAKAVSVIPLAKDVVYTLTNSGLSAVGADGTSADGFTTTSSEWSFDTDGMQVIVDANPNVTAFCQLLIMGSSAGAPALWAFNGDTAAGTLLGPFALTGVPEGTLVGACLARCQMDARLVALLSTSGGLQVVDLGSQILVSLGQSGSATPCDPPVAVAVAGCGASLPVSFTTGMLIADPDTLASNGNEQIAVCYPDTASASYGYCLSVLDFVQTDGTYTLTLVGTDGFALSACLPPGQPDAVAYGIASGPLMDNGLDQLVVGYSGTYGAPAVGGCVALVLLQYALSVPVASPVFVGAPRDAATGGWQTFCSLDLAIMGGLFGSSDQTAQLGILIVGSGATLKQLDADQATLTSAIVPVNPATGQLPATPSDAPYDLTQYGCATGLMTVQASATTLLAMPSDTCGNSVILGTPTLTTVAAASQILACIQAIPYEASAAETAPTLAFSFTQSTTDGYLVTANKSWTFTIDAGANFGMAGASVGAKLQSSYGKNFTNTTNSTQTESLTVVSNIVDEDTMIVYQVGYQVWLYPLYQPATQAETDGQLAVVFPVNSTAVQTVQDANDPDYGYLPQSEIGLLISYPTSIGSLSDYSGGSAIFTPFSVEAQNNNDNTLVYSASRMTTDTQSLTTTVFNSLNAQSAVKFNANLFDYVPANFGLDLSAGLSWSTADTTTTTSTCSSALSLTFKTGTQINSDCPYLFTPYVYFDNTYGCFMVSYLVDLSPGESWWKNHYGEGHPVCIRVFPTSPNPIRSWFTRSIGFVSDDDGSPATSVTVSLFNASFNPATGIVVTVYAGAPVSSGSTIAPSTDTVLGTASIAPSLDGTASYTVTIPLTPSLAVNDSVTVGIRSVEWPTEYYYWGVYPMSQFPNLDLDG